MRSVVGIGLTLPCGRACRRVHLLRRRLRLTRCLGWRCETILRSAWLAVYLLLLLLLGILLLWLLARRVLPIATLCRCCVTLVLPLLRRWLLCHLSILAAILSTHWACAIGLWRCALAVGCSSCRQLTLKLLMVNGR